MADENTEPQLPENEPVEETPEVPGDDTPVEPESPIVFIVEDGSRVLGADSYITLEEANIYQTNRNRSDWLALSDDDKKVTLIKATQYIDRLFNWKGRRKWQSQDLAFPRVMLRDVDGFEVTGIPKVLKEAVCEAAFYAYQADLTNSELFTTYDENGAVKRQRVEGAVEVEYFNANETEIDYISKYASLNSILYGLYREKNQHSVNAKACWGWDY